MKTCPICGARAVENATTCFECLYSFIEMSISPVEKEEEREEIAEVPSKKSFENALSGEHAGDIFLELWKKGRLQKKFISHNGSLYIGSAGFNDVFLKSSRVAKRQLHLYRQDGDMYLDILDFSYPVFLNGQELDGAVPVKADDAISLEDVRLVVSS
ncbi:MAG: FHA domain-containing protein [Coriobacteriia bacterium]|nr:FHA domain-containing protein [Coriobacteriia bacterium]